MHTKALVGPDSAALINMYMQLHKCKSVVAPEGLPMGKNPCNPCCFVATWEFKLYWDAC